MNLHHFLQNTKFLLLEHGIFRTLKFIVKLFFLQIIKNKRFYNFCDWNELKKKKKSDKVFLLGSGYSLNYIKKEEWEKISKHDVIGFNSTVRQKWVRVDYHLVRGWAEGSNVYADLEKMCLQLSLLINNNKNYKDTILLLQNDFYGIISHLLLNKKLLAKNSNIFNYYTLNSKTPKEDKKLNLLSHITGTLSDVTHFALNMGWKEVILVGVDLYDSRYFWLKKDETYYIDSITGKTSVSKFTEHGNKFDDNHSTVNNGVLDEFKIWNKIFNEKGLKLMIYNKKSLLKTVLKIYDSH